MHCYQQWQTLNYKQWCCLAHTVLIFHIAEHCKENINIRFCCISDSCRWFNHNLRSYYTIRQLLPASCVCTRSTSVLHIKLSNIRTTSLVALTDASDLKSFLQTKFPSQTLNWSDRESKKGWVTFMISTLRLQSPINSCENLGEILLPEIGSSAADFLQFASQIRVQLFQCVGLWAGGLLGSHI